MFLIIKSPDELCGNKHVMSTRKAWEAVANTHQRRLHRSRWWETGGHGIMEAATC